MLLTKWSERTATHGFDPAWLPNSGVRRSLLPGISNAILQFGLTAAKVNGAVTTKVDSDREFRLLGGGVA